MCVRYRDFGRYVEYDISDADGHFYGCWQKGSLSDVWKLIEQGYTLCLDD